MLYTIISLNSKNGRCLDISSCKQTPHKDTYDSIFSVVHIILFSPQTSHTPLTLHQVMLTFAWAHVRAVTEPCRSLLCEETLNGSDAGRAAAVQAQPTYCLALSLWSYALHLHTHTHTHRPSMDTSTRKGRKKQNSHIYTDMYRYSTHTRKQAWIQAHTETHSRQCGDTYYYYYRCHSLTECRTSHRDVLHVNDQLADRVAGHVSYPEEQTVSAMSLSDLRSDSVSQFLFQPPWLARRDKKKCGNTRPIHLHRLGSI